VDTQKINGMNANTTREAYDCPSWIHKIMGKFVDDK
jgi:hypothetical protein